MEVRAIVLAAGRSSRMGHPKALTRLGDAPALARIVAACAAAGLARPLVVVGADGARVRGALPALDVEWVSNPDPDAGRTGSLQRALAAAPTLRAALVWPVDHPLALASTARALVDVEGEWVTPRHAGRAGHPFVLRGAALSGARAAAPDAPLRDVLATGRVTRRHVDVDDAGVLANLDTPADLVGL